MTAEHAHALDAGGEVEGAAFIKRLVGAWDCCGTCAGGVLAVHARATRQTAADTVLATARAECCGENPAPDHSARADHSERMAFAGRLAAAVRAS